MPRRALYTGAIIAMHYGMSQQCIVVGLIMLWGGSGPSYTYKSTPPKQEKHSYIYTDRHIYKSSECLDYYLTPTTEGRGCPYSIDVCLGTPTKNLKILNFLV